MKQFISLAVFALSLTAHAGIHCKVNYHMDGMELPEEVGPGSKFFFTADISKLDTSMPQKFYADYALKNLKWMGESSEQTLYRVTANKAEGRNDNMAIFDLSQRVKPGEKQLIYLPNDLGHQASGKTVQGYWLFLDTEEVASGIIMQSIPLTCNLTD